MKLHTISTGSKANSFVLEYIKEKYILLDAGCNTNEVMQVVSKPSAISLALVTHSHKDHSRYIRSFVKLGTDIYLPYYEMDDKEKYKLYDNHFYKPHNIHYVEDGKKFSKNGIKVVPFEVIHDVKNMGFFFKTPNDKRVAYVTDTAFIPVYFKKIDSLICECNYVSENMLKSGLEESVKTRIIESHMSVERLVSYLEKMDKSCLKSIILTHISEERGNNQVMIEAIRAVAGSKVKVQIARGGRTIRL